MLIFYIEASLSAILGAMSRNAWIVFVVLCVALVGGLVWASRGEKLKVDDVNIWQTVTGEERNGQIADHIYGNKDAKVVLIEYGDYQCPGCGDAYPIIKQVTEKYKGQLAFVFRNFPLVTMHPNARAAAAAAEAAGLQGKFWEMHNKLYENQSDWENLTGAERTDKFTEYATSFGLDKTKFLKDLTSDAVAKKIDFDVALGNKAGVSSTPSIYVQNTLASQRVAGGKLVPDTAANRNSPYVWASASDFENLILKPAFKEKGVDISKVK